MPGGKFTRDWSAGDGNPITFKARQKEGGTDRDSKIAKKRDREGWRKKERNIDRSIDRYREREEEREKKKKKRER